MSTTPLRGAIFENFVVNELRKLYIHHAQRLPLEIKAGLTVAADAFRELDRFAKLSDGPKGMLVHGGGEGYMRQGHQVRAWWMCS